MEDKYKPGKKWLGEILFILLAILLTAWITFFILIYPDILQAIFGTPTPGPMPIPVP